MASKTFYNLTLERQETIMTVAYEEFALKGYRSASLSEIIKKLNLAKGSFYRYFDSKKNLYEFLLQNATERRLSKLKLLIDRDDIDIFELIKLNFQEKIKFDMENPLIGGFLYRIMHEREESEVAEIVQSLYARIIEETRNIITLPKFQAQLAGFSPELMSFQIFHMQLWLYDYVAYKFKINYEFNIKNHRSVIDLREGELNELINDSVAMLKEGIQRQ